jgi:hypothetical protein
MFSSRNRYEGEFVFDRHTIVPLWQNQTILGVTYSRDNRPASFPENQVWYYTLSGDTLEIKYSGDLLFILGVYKKIH